MLGTLNITQQGSLLQEQTRVPLAFVNDHPVVFSARKNKLVLTVFKVSSLSNRKDVDHFCHILIVIFIQNIAAPLSATTA